MNNEKLNQLNEVNKNDKNKDQLIDGKKYFLGASTAKYDQKNDVFLFGNCYVDRCKCDQYLLVD